MSDLQMLTGGGGLSLRRRMMMQSTGGGSLPAGYIALNWISPAGSQAYINTGIKASSKVSCWAKVYRNQTSDKYMLGVRINSSSGNFALTEATSIRWYNTTYNADFQKGAITEIEFGNGYVKKNGNTITTFTPYDFTTNLNIYLCMLNNNGNPANQFGASSRLYAVKLWENDKLVRNFVPCVENSTSVVGMYDFVTGVFFAKQGSGSFITG